MRIYGNNKKLTKYINFIIKYALNILIIKNWRFLQDAYLTPQIHFVYSPTGLRKQPSISCKSCVHTANSNTLLPDMEVSFLASIHHYPDGIRHRWSVVSEKGRLPIPVVYRWLQPWMDLQEGAAQHYSQDPSKDGL